MFENLPEGGANDYYIVSLVAPGPRLTLTTTTDNAIADVVVLVETVGSQGDIVAVYQAVPVAEETTNVDFAFLSNVLYDFGDLPDSYSTRLPNGARHVLADTPNLYLGDGVSAEPDGQPSGGGRCG